MVPIPAGVTYLADKRGKYKNLFCLRRGGFYYLDV
jgi:hypothetical protein